MGKTLETQYPITIKPRNPEQNGKIESFWKKLDDFINGLEEIGSYVYKYNYLKAHLGLEKSLNVIYKRSCDVFNDTYLKLKRDYPWTWFKDGKEVNFKVYYEKNHYD